jgi:hypothetical protein
LLVESEEEESIGEGKEVEGYHDARTKKEK